MNCGLELNKGSEMNEKDSVWAVVCPSEDNGIVTTAVDGPDNQIMVMPLVFKDENKIEQIKKALKYGAIVKGLPADKELVLHEYKLISETPLPRKG